MDALNVNMADFSLNLLKEVGVNNSNVFCSPLSISIVLAMTFAGSGGDTKKQIRSTIFGNDTNDETIHSAFNNILTDSLALPAGEPRTGSRGAVLNRGELLRLQIANSLFPSKRLMTGHPIHQNYLTMLRNNYKLEGDIPILDYSQAESAAKFINDWINAKTSGKIKNLIAKESLTANTAMLLVNAIYFKSPWLYPFEKRITSSENFYKSATDAGSSVQMMKLTKSLPYYTDSNEKFQLARLPYSNPKYSLFVVLPQERDGVNIVLSNLNGSKLLSALNRAVETELQVWLPKFKMASTFKLKPVLKNLGISELFSNANLTGISEASLFVEEVTHMAIVEVDEDGTEAAAATAVELAFRSAVREPDPIEFKVDHPFLMGIWEKIRNQIIFLGKMTSPA